MSINKQFTPHHPTVFHPKITPTPPPTHAGKAKIDTFNKSKEKKKERRLSRVLPEKGSRKKLARKWGGKLEKWRVENEQTGREDESQVTAGGSCESEEKWAEGA